MGVDQTQNFPEEKMTTRIIVRQSLTTFNNGYQMVFENGITVSVIRPCDFHDLLEVMIWARDGSVIQYQAGSDVMTFQTSNNVVAIMAWAANLPSDR
jgi:hypothetical protein